jgi:hypothetical protein
VELQPLPPVQDDIAAGVEVDLMHRQERQPAGLLGVREHLLRVLRVHGVRHLAGQSRDHRLDRAVTVPSGAERTEKLHPDGRSGRELAFVVQPAREQARGTHRSHRVRTGRTDADLEQVEGAEGHTFEANVTRTTPCTPCQET